MMNANDIKRIVEKRNAKLNKPTRIRSTRSHNLDSQFQSAFGPAPKYVLDAVTRALAIGKRS